VNSFGIWAKYKAGIMNKIAMDVHANLWDIGKKSDSAFIDFGLMIPDYRNLETITIALPFLVQKSSIQDLSDIISINTVGSLVFNTDCVAHSSAKAGGFQTKTLSLDNSDQHILLLPIDEKQDYYGINIKIEPTNGVSCIKINFANLRDEFKKYNKMYLRFRVRDSEIKKAMFCKLKKPNYFLESAFTQTQIIDFMVNELRSITPALNEAMKNAKMELVELSKVHFFVMEPAERDVTLSDVECRRLEVGWNEYLESGYGPNTLVYHWSLKAEKNKSFSNYSKLVKVTSSKTNITLIIIYILIIVGLSILSNICFSLLCKYFSGFNAFIS